MTKHMIESTQLIKSEPLTTQEIQDWLAEHLSEQLGIAADEIAIHTPLSRYGVSSMQAMAIADQGKQRFGLEISPLVIWSYPNIASLARYFSEELNDSDSESFEI